jgi:organic hydroperoxide reductase OsmC/OhrA
MKGEPVRYKYMTNLSWSSEKKGILKSMDKPNIEVACPPEFGGHKNIWSPEELFVASVEICIMTTFLWFTNREKLSLLFYKSKAEGVVEMVSGVFQFSSIDIEVTIGISSENDRNKTENIMKKVDRACLISNSIRTPVKVETKIVINGKDNT